MGRPEAWLAMRSCRICHCLCDPGDLEQGVCDDCRAEMRKKEETKENTERLMKAEFKQMELEDMI